MHEKSSKWKNQNLHRSGAKFINYSFKVCFKFKGTKTRKKWSVFKCEITVIVLKALFPPSFVKHRAQVCGGKILVSISIKRRLQYAICFIVNLSKVATTQNVFNKFVDKYNADNIVFETNVVKKGKETETIFVKNDIETETETETETENETETETEIEIETETETEIEIETETGTETETETEIEIETEIETEIEIETETESDTVTPEIEIEAALIEDYVVRSIHTHFFKSITITIASIIFALNSCISALILNSNESNHVQMFTSKSITNRHKLLCLSNSVIIISVYRSPFRHILLWCLSKPVYSKKPEPSDDKLGGRNVLPVRDKITYTTYAFQRVRSKKIKNVQEYISGRSR